MHLKIVVEDKWMFRVYCVQFVLITETGVENSVSLNLGTIGRRTYEYQSTWTIFMYTVEYRYSELQQWPNYLLH